MQTSVTQGPINPVTQTSESYRNSVVHLDDGATRIMNQKIDGPPHLFQTDLWGTGATVQPEFIPQELTSVSVQQPMSLDDPYSVIDGCSAPSEIIVEFVDSQKSGGLDIEAYKPRIAKPKHRPTATADRQQRSRGSHLVRKLVTPSSARSQKQFVPCNTSQALDIADLSTDMSTSNSLRAPLKNSKASVRLAYFKHKKPVSEVIPSSTRPEPSATHLDNSFKRSSHFKSSCRILNSKLDVSYIATSMPYIRHMSAPRSPRSASREKPLGLSVKGKTLSYREQITPSKTGRVLKETDLLKITASHGKPIKNPLNDDLLSLTHPFSNHPLYRSALYTGEVRSLYIQADHSKRDAGFQNYDSRHLQRLMRPTISSAGKVSTYAKYLSCTDLVKNLPLESDDYAHPDNNISTFVDYRVDTQLHLGADKAPLPATSMSTTDRVINEIMAEQAEERNAHIRLLSRIGQHRPKSAPIRVEAKININSQTRRPKSAILAFMSEAQTVETILYKRKPSMSPELTTRVTSQDFQEEYSTEVTLNDSFPPLIKRSNFLPTPSPKNHVLAIKKSNVYKHRRKCDYAGEECSSMDHFTGEVDLQKRLQGKKGLKSTIPQYANLQLSGQPTGKEISTPTSARPSQKRVTQMETNSYGSVISPQLSTGIRYLRQISPCKDHKKSSNLCTRSQGAKKKQTIERIRQLTSPEHMQDICIRDKSSDYLKWSKCLESPKIAPIQVVVKESQEQAVSDPRPWSSLFRKHVDDAIFNSTLKRPQSADLFRNYERSMNKRINGAVHSRDIYDLQRQVTVATPVFIPTMPVLYQPQSPDRLWKEQENITEKKAVQENKISIERRSTTSYTTNFSNLTGLTSKTGSGISGQSMTFLQGYSRGRAHYFNSHPPSASSNQQHGSMIIGRGALTVQVPYGGLVSPHKNCFLAQIDEEERFAYSHGQYADPTGLARSIQLATNLGGRSLK